MLPVRGIIVPELTVLLPARNAAGTIGTAVRSTLRALPSDAQLFVLDDGSTDSTAEEALEAGCHRGGLDPRLVVESRPASGGLPNALNWMLQHTDSTLVGRMDADDISLPWRFRSQLAAMGRGIDMVFSQVLPMKGKLARFALPAGIPPEAFGLHLLLTNPVSHPTMLATRDALERAGGYRQVPAEDYDLWLRAAAGGARIRRLGVFGLAYRFHPGQITASTAWRHSSWHNPEQAEAFGDLAEKLLGVRLERIVAIAHKNPAEKEQALAHFQRAITPAIARVSGPQRLLLTRRLAERARWARATHTTESQS